MSYSIVVLRTPLFPLTTFRGDKDGKGTWKWPMEKQKMKKLETELEVEMEMQPLLLAFVSRCPRALPASSL